MQSTIEIQRSRESVFKLLSNLQGYKSWLPPSQIYRGIQNISTNNVEVGTRYIDKGKYISFQGIVTEVNSPQSLTFVQEATFKASGRLEVHIHYLAVTTSTGTRLTRKIALYTRGSALLLRPIIMEAIRKENKRILRSVKTYLEAR